MKERETHRFTLKGHQGRSTKEWTYSKEICLLSTTLQSSFNTFLLKNSDIVLLKIQRGWWGQTTQGAEVVVYVRWEQSGVIFKGPVCTILAASTVMVWTDVADGVLVLIPDFSDVLTVVSHHLVLGATEEIQYGRLFTSVSSCKYKILSFSKNKQTIKHVLVCYFVTSPDIFLIFFSTNRPL